VLASSPRYDAVKFENGRSTTTEEERDAARAKLVLLLDKMEEALKPAGWSARLSPSRTYQQFRS
jgi:hypothetical protein